MNKQSSRSVLLCHPQPRGAEWCHCPLATAMQEIYNPESKQSSRSPTLGLGWGPWLCLFSTSLWVIGAHVPLQVLLYCKILIFLRCLQQLLPPPHCFHFRNLRLSFPEGSLKLGRITNVQPIGGNSRKQEAFRNFLIPRISAYATRMQLSYGKR